MFRVLAPVTIHPTAEARQALGPHLRPAGRAAWRAIASRKLGLEFAHLPFHFEGVSLALASHLRPDGFIVIELGLHDGTHPDRVITTAQYRRNGGR